MEVKETIQSRLNIREYAKVFGQQDKHALADVKKVIGSLYEQRVFMKRDEGFKDIDCRWLSCKPELIDDGYTLSIKWSTEIIPYISKLSGRYFTSYTLGDVSKVSSFYGIRLYEYILCDIGENNKKKKHIPDITIEKLRFMLGIGENKHVSFSNLNSSVINPAIRAINRDTSMVVEAKVYKRGRKAIAIRFILGEVCWLKKVKREGITILVSIYEQES